MAKGKKPYNQAAVDKALAELDDVAKRFPSLFPESIKGLKPKGEYYASPKVWTERADFEAQLATFVEGGRRGKDQVQEPRWSESEFPGPQRRVPGLPRKIPRQGLTVARRKARGANA